MAKDFVKLSEVAVLEEITDNATVLVEENGEIYRAPKTQVGGAGGADAWDFIIRDTACNIIWIREYGEIDTSGFVFEKGDADSLMEALLNSNQPPRICFASNEEGASVICIPSLASAYSGSGYYASFCIPNGPSYLYFEFVPYGEEWYGYCGGLVEEGGK